MKEREGELATNGIILDGFSDSPGLPYSGSCDGTNSSSEPDEVMSPASRLRRYTDTISALGGASRQRRMSIYGLLVQTGFGETALARGFKSSLNQEGDSSVNPKAISELGAVVNVAFQREEIESIARNAGMDFITYQKMQLLGLLESIGRRGDTTRDHVAEIIKVMETLPSVVKPGSGDGFVPYFKLLYNRNEQQLKVSTKIVQVITEKYGLLEALENACQEKPEAAVTEEPFTLAAKAFNLEGLPERQDAVIEWLAYVEKMAASGVSTSLGINDELGSSGMSYMPTDGLSASGNTQNSLTPKAEDTITTGAKGMEGKAVVATSAAEAPAEEVSNGGSTRWVQKQGLVQTESFCFGRGRETEQKEPLKPNLDDEIYQGSVSTLELLRIGRSSVRKR